jgi:pyruvate,water dikinase
VIEQYHLTERVKPIVTGRSVGQKIGKGKARMIQHPKQMNDLQKGEVLVAEMTDPDWEPIMKHASAIVTNRGGRTCHAAIIARELGIPAVVGCADATDKISTGHEVTVSCAEGETGFIYPGLLKYDVCKTEIKNLADIPVKIRMNLANPDIAFATQFLPNDGVGLARLEFIISNMVSIHPNALLRTNEVTENVRQEIIKKTIAYKSPIDFYIEKIAEGVATIAAAFYPKPIIVRFSDFKSNEYRHLLGGEFFEPEEENPMLGFRGGSRYLSPEFSQCFALECEAIQRVRKDKGLLNTHVMFPFVRTVAEAKQLVSLMEQNGLNRGEEGLQVFMMCEVPSNVILAEDFLQYFDGYSIGSNDLTQLTLGLDRDSELLADLFDERNAAVKALLHQVIQTCKRLNKQIGICGQGPSDHPDFAQWLVKEGIGSLSLNPDSIVKTWMTLGEK